MICNSGSIRTLSRPRRDVAIRNDPAFGIRWPGEELFLFFCIDRINIFHPLQVQMGGMDSPGEHAEGGGDEQLRGRIEEGKQERDPETDSSMK